ncbi:low temperature requirement protein A [Photobacterium sp. 2_MG-2023]|uniref:low temperature requirement protein A n=1 Tax=Photobacterium TaxID=657 RepID=UPI001CDCBB79|nr:MULTISPECIES: low temperature requirement protein A [Photobacterium]MDO6581051.1 low temperature requirement protein A [Photobacterium sp. 2_MG-2023]
MIQSMILKLAPKAALRQLATDEHPHVTNIELFFDLVYVFTIIQLSHFLLAHSSWLGALEALTLFAAVWWSWNYTAWATNWLDPDHARGRMLMVVLMACALLMAIAMPLAFSSRAGLFAGAYVVMALTRAGYMALVFRGERMGQNYAQLGAWSGISGLFWMAGVWLPELRLGCWMLAVVIDYAAPYVGFWLPGKGATPMESWPLRGLHLLERNQQVFIIALGESILLLGGLLVGNALHADTLAAATVGFFLIVTLWWIYFVHLTEAGEHRFLQEADHTKLARASLAYAHGIMVGGAIVTAVAIELIVDHPLEPVHLPVVTAAAAGPSIFLFGSAMFRRTIAKKMPFAYLIAVVALVLWSWLAFSFHWLGLWLGTGVLGILLSLARFGGEGNRA